MRKGLRGHFYAGLIVILPLFLTIFIINWMVNLIISITMESFFTTFINNAIKSLGIDDNIHLKWTIYILYLLSIIVFITFIGYITKNIIGKKITRQINKVIGKLPIIKHVYTTINQIVSLISSSKDGTFKKAVAVEYPRKGIYSIGFLTSEDNESISKATGKDLCNVFIPTSPNPTSGMYICVEKKDVTILDIKIDDAIKLIISGGVIVPGMEKKEIEED